MNWKKRLAVLVVASVGVLVTSTSNAGLTLLQANPGTPATFIGNGGYSADGLGQLGSGGLIQAEVPAGSTVFKAYLYGAYAGNFQFQPEYGTIVIDGTPVELQKISEDLSAKYVTARADITALVSAKVGGGGGITDFAVNSDPAQLDGVALVVIYSNPAMPAATIAILDGSGSAHDEAGFPQISVTTLHLAASLDKSSAGFYATMSLGIGGGGRCGPPMEGA